MKENSAKKEEEKKRSSNHPDQKSQKQINFYIPLVDSKLFVSLFIKRLKTGD